MRIRMKVALSGTRNGKDWPPPGETIDLPDNEAAAMCAAGLADPVKDEPKPETAKAPEDDVEKRAPARRGRPPKNQPGE